MGGDFAIELYDKVTHLVTSSVFSAEYEVSKFISLILYLLYSFIIRFNSF